MFSQFDLPIDPDLLKMFGVPCDDPACPFCAKLRSPGEEVEDGNGRERNQFGGFGGSDFSRLIEEAFASFGAPDDSVRESHSNDEISDWHPVFEAYFERGMRDCFCGLPDCEVGKKLRAINNLVTGNSQPLNLSEIKKTVRKEIELERKYVAAEVFVLFKSRLGSWWDDLWFVRLFRWLVNTIKSILISLWYVVTMIIISPLLVVEWGVVYVWGLFCAHATKHVPFKPNDKIEKWVVVGANDAAIDTYGFFRAMFDVKWYESMVKTSQEVPDMMVFLESLLHSLEAPPEIMELLDEISDQDEMPVPKSIVRGRKVGEWLEPVMPTLRYVVTGFVWLGRALISPVIAYVWLFNFFYMIFEETAPDMYYAVASNTFWDRVMYHALTRGSKVRQFFVRLNRDRLDGFNKQRRWLKALRLRQTRIWSRRFRSWMEAPLSWGWVQVTKEFFTLMFVYQKREENQPETASAESEEEGSKQ